MASTARLGTDYQARVREGFHRRWIDVYENKGKRSGAYSAPVYGAHPYMLPNYNDTLDAVVSPICRVVDRLRSCETTIAAIACTARSPSRGSAHG